MKNKKDKGDDPIPTQLQFNETLGHFGEIMRLAQLGLKYQEENSGELEKEAREKQGHRGFEALSFVANFLKSIDEFYKEETSE